MINNYYFMNNFTLCIIQNIAKLYFDHNNKLDL